jgi:GntR family transcriptional regulator
MLAKGKRPGTKVLQLEVTPATIPAARSLDLSPGEETILLKRVRLKDDEPLAIETAYLPFRLCTGLQDRDLENRSLYEILTDEFGIFPTRAEQQLEAVACRIPLIGHSQGRSGLAYLPGDLPGRRAPL